MSDILGLNEAALDYFNKARAGTLPGLGGGPATQSGTWTVQPGNTANTTAWLVTGTGGTFPVTGTFWQATQPVSGTFWQATQPVSIATAPVLVAGSAIIGKVGIDQTTPGTTNNTALDGVVDGTTTNASVTSATTVLTFANTAGYSYIAFGFTSIGSGNTIVVDGASDGSTYNQVIPFSVYSTGNGPASSSTPVTTATYVVPVTAQAMRIRVSVYGSGTVTCYGTLKRGAVPNPVNLSVSPGTTTVQGGVASGATDSGNPVKVGGVYNSTYPSPSTGQRVDVQVDSRGNQRVSINDGNGNTPATVGTAADAGGLGNALQVKSIPLVFNGATVDRTRSIQGADGTGLGVLAVEEGGRAFSNITTATTTTVKSGSGHLHTLTVNTFVASATLTIYDNTAASGTKIATITLPGTITSDAPFTLTYDLRFATGLTIVTSGATDLTVTYR